MRQEAIALVSTVQTFDQSYVSVKESENRLKLNRNQRETIEQFHARLIAQLTALGADPAGSTEAPVQEEAPAAEPDAGSDPAG